MKTLVRILLASAVISSFVAEAAAQAPAPGEPWSFSAGFTGSLEGNALFLGPGGDEEFAQYLTAALSRQWVLRRGSVTATGSASQPFYRESTPLNNFRYDIAGSSTYSVTRRLTWVGSGAVSSGLARDAAVLTDVGVVLPTVTARTSASSSALSYVLTRQSQISWTASHTSAGFSSATLGDGASFGSTVRWTHQLIDTQSVGVTQSYQRTYFSGVPASIHGLLATWQGSAGGDWTAYASGGLQPYTVPSETGYRFATALSVGIRKPVGQRQSLSTSFDRRIEQSFGIGNTNHLVHSVSADYGLALLPNLSTSISANYSRGTSPVSDAPIIGRTASAAITYLVTNYIGVVFGSSAYGYRVPPAAEVRSYRIFTSLNFTTTWR